MKRHEQPFRFWVELAIAASVVVHLSLFADANGGIAAVLQSSPGRIDAVFFLFGLPFIIGVLFGPYIVLWIGRTKFHSATSRGVILCSAIGFSLFDLWGYFGGGDKQWFVVLGPLVIVFPASLLSIWLAHKVR